MIRIEYVTSPTAPALQWLDRQADRRQASAVHVHAVRAHRRPQLDSAAGHAAGARHLHGRIIHTADDVLAVMSAKNDPKAKRNGEYAFVMPDAIPSYLIALGGRRSALQGDRSAHRRVCGEAVDGGGGQGIRRHRRA